ncbi:MAG: peptidoglycan-binding protein LysM [Methylococcales bacterium]|nr:peptidoglycan-binding protein LysM [Methylococcales bacterium]
MGLFDFAKGIGSKIFGNDEEAAEKITGHILANNPGVENLTAAFNDGTVTLIGEANTIEAAQKVVLMAGNVQGVTEVIPKISVAAAETTDINAALEPDDVEYYIIQSGDSLSKIAKKYYQDASAYPRIFDANKEVIKDANLIYPGQKIRIPLG